MTVLITDVYRIVNQYANAECLHEVISTIGANECVFSGAYEQLEECPNINDLFIYHSDVVESSNIPIRIRTLYIGMAHELCTLPPLPNLLRKLTCLHTNFRPYKIPISLRILTLEFSGPFIPDLHEGLKELYLEHGRYTELPTLPTTLSILWCNSNRLTSIPTLPPRLLILNASYNAITSLPTLPPFLSYLYCEGTSLTSLPDLPNNLRVLIIDDTPIEGKVSIPSHVRLTREVVAMTGQVIVNPT